MNLSIKEVATLVKAFCVKLFLYFRRKLTSLEELEKIEEKIQGIEKYKEETEQRQKRVVGRLVVYSVGLYVLAAAVFYFLFFPASLRDRLFYIIPLLIFPIIVILTKKLISWYYVKRVTEQQDLLLRLRTDKKQLLEQVMEKETYKVARTILEKFAPDQLRNSKGVSNLAIVAKPTTPLNTSKALVPVINNNLTTRSLPALPPLTPGMELRHRSTILSQKPQPLLTPMQAVQPVVPRVRPILPKESGIMDRIIETLVGDGPSWRYALICAKCYGHNGMALREEFSFIGFRCCYCSFFNPARKQRPISPKITTKEELRPESSSTSDSDSDNRLSDEKEATTNESKDCNNIESGVEMSSPETVEESEDKLPAEKINDTSESPNTIENKVD